jgi:hypothetical protein
MSGRGGSTSPLPLAEVQAVRDRYTSKELRFEPLAEMMTPQARGAFLARRRNMYACLPSQPQTRTHMGQASGLLMWMTRPHKAEAAPVGSLFLT